MNNLNVVGIDLAKNIIQVSIVTPAMKELQNKAFSRKKFSEFLARQKPSMVAFEACATAHYWSRIAHTHGHTARIIPAKAVSPFRQGHKTDSNDALAVAEAASRPNIKEAPMKTVEQQGIQAIQRSRELLVHDRTALSNHVHPFGYAVNDRLQFQREGNAEESLHDGHPLVLGYTFSGHLDL